MPEFVLGHTQQWFDYFRSRGYAAEPLGAGVEGAVYDLGRGLVAKVWRERGTAELSRMQRFYADVASAGLPFGTPEIVSVEQAAGAAVTYERKLPGEPLQQRLGHDDQAIGCEVTRCILDVLSALATVPATSSMRQLAVLDEDRPLRAGADSFLAALLSLLTRRVARFGPVLRDRLPDFDRRYSALTDRLAVLESCPDTVVHGDLFGGNVLVDARARPLAVLDFGFLTTAGDPRLDAAVTACIMNMYGQHAASITRDLTAQFAAVLGHPAEVLLIYQAAYAVATSNAFTSDGSDGHFAWCVDQLSRADVAAAIGI